MLLELKKQNQHRFVFYINRKG